MCQTGDAELAHLLGEVSLGGDYELVTALECLESFFHAFDDLQFVKCQFGDDLLYTIIYMLRQDAAAQLECRVGHAYHIGLRTISEEGNVVLLLAPQHVLHAFGRGVVGQELDELRFRRPEVPLILPEGVVSVEEYGAELFF